MATVLSSVTLRLRLFLILEIALGVISAGLLLVWLLILGDAVFIFSEGIRSRLPSVLVMIAASVFLWGLARVLRLSDAAAAKRMEAEDASFGNLLSNAVALTGRKPESAIEQVLCTKAIEMGNAAARQISVRSHVKKDLWKRFRVAGLAVFCFVIFAAAFRGGMSAVVPRLLDPSGDHPPYSRLVIDTVPGNTSVIYGGNLEIRAETAGRPVDRLYLVASTPRGTRQLSMFRGGTTEFVQMLSNIQEPTTYHVTDGRARSWQFQVSVRYTPRITDLNLTLDYPFYTSLPSKTLSSPEGTLKVPARTELIFDVDSNRPLSGGEIRITPVQGGEIRTLSLSEAPATGGNRVTASVTADQPFVYHISVTDTDHLVSAETVSGRVDLIEDASPSVFMVKPDLHTVATPDSVVPVSFQIEDDYAVSRVFWYRGINQSIERAGELPVDRQTAQSRIRFREALDLKSLGVRPGDVISFFIEAIDNFPDQPNVATSRMYQVQVISQAEYEMIRNRADGEKMVLDRYEDLGRALRKLAASAKKLAESLPAEPDTAAAELEGLVRALEAYRNQLQKALEHPVELEIERLFRKNHEVQLQTIDAMVQSISEKEGGSKGSEAEKIRQLAGVLSEMAQLEESSVSKPSREIQSVAWVMHLAREYSRMVETQEEHVRMSRRFAASDIRFSRLTRLELQEFSRREEVLRDRLEALFKTLQAKASALPDAPEFDALRQSVEEFVGNAEWLHIPELLSEASGAFGDLDGKTGHASAVKALDRMKSFLSACNRVGQSGGQALSFRPGMQQAVRRSLEQLMGMFRYGSSGTSGDGYSVFKERAALFGPEGEAGLRFSDETENEKADAGGDLHREMDRKIAGMPEDEAAAMTGQGAEVVYPAAYRRLVGAYFQSIADASLQPD